MATGHRSWRDELRARGFRLGWQASLVAAWTVFVAVAAGYGTGEYLAAATGLHRRAMATALYPHLYDAFSAAALWLVFASLLLLVDKATEERES